ncbi:ferrous iron transport protein A [Ruaniaceae bacterium KH17]|nr:ferrous iron transport protein A [Ruaniaceae bacterium KH17]
MTVSECRVRQLVRVVSIDLPDPLRAAEIGVRPGALVHVTQRSAFGGVVIAVDGGRLALDAATAKRVVVEEAAA